MIETCETAELQKGRGDWYLVWGEQIRGGEGERPQTEPWGASIFRVSAKKAQPSRKKSETEGL